MTRSGRSPAPLDGVDVKPRRLGEGRAGLNRAAVFGIVVALLYACRSHGDFDNRADADLTVVSCEEAFAHLAECCPGLDVVANGFCDDREYQETNEGCGSYSQESGHELPELSMEESRCVRSLSCEAIAQHGICEKVVKNAKRGDHSSYYRETDDLSDTPTSSSGEYPHEAVCP